MQVYTGKDFKNTHAVDLRRLRDGTKTRARRKHYNRLLFYHVHLLNHSSTSRDTAPQHSFKESKEKTTLKDKGVRLDPWVFISWSLVDRKSSHETVQVTCTLEVPRWGDPRRPVPTAASVAAVEPRLCQGEMIRAPAGNALRGMNGSFMLS